ncbi:MAG TPA: ubiquinone/menaquinone biosynthesis methyltransferase [Chthonomonadales bacterium]|nr:ubiquinone/menaquinone biosynthesis methyltransferase [Chthonomonadales bacterium]
MLADAARPRAEGSDRAERIRRMFARIAPRYDLLNSLLSLWRHAAWRRAAVREAGLRRGDSVLDCCTGTGDLARALRSVVGPSGLVVGADFCEPMLRLARTKHSANLGASSLTLGDALDLPFRTAAFNAATVAFGLRNVDDPTRAIAEMGRVVAPGGRVVILEFGRPPGRLARIAVETYQRCVLPAVGAVLSDRRAYSYLQRSIREFSSPAEVLQMMGAAGILDVRVQAMNLGSVCIYAGTRR